MLVTFPAQQITVLKGEKETVGEMLSVICRIAKHLGLRCNSAGYFLAVYLIASRDFADSCDFTTEKVKNQGNNANML